MTAGALVREGEVPLLAASTRWNVGNAEPLERPVADIGESAERASVRWLRS